MDIPDILTWGKPCFVLEAGVMRPYARAVKTGKSDTKDQDSSSQNREANSNVCTLYYCVLYLQFVLQFTL